MVNTMRPDDNDNIATFEEADVEGHRVLRNAPNEVIRNAPADDGDDDTEGHRIS